MGQIKDINTPKYAYYGVFRCKVFLLIWSILEARAEILQKLRFWQWSFKENYF